MYKIGRSLVLSTGTYGLQLAISLGLVIIVSRLLPPAEIGAYLIASAVMILVMPIRDFQLQSYVMQLKIIDSAALRPAVLIAWLSFAASLIIVLFSAVIFDLAYPDNAIAICLVIMSVSLVSRPFALLPMSLLARELRYGTIAWIQLTGAVAKVVVTLSLIASDLGAAALAWGYVAELAVEMTSIAFVEAKYRFFVPAKSGVGEVVSFAAPFTAANLVLTISLAAIPIIIGGFLGLASSAFFNRARTVTQFFRSNVEGAVHQIVLQRFATLKSEQSLLRKEYVRSIVLLTAISWPSLAWIFVTAEPFTLLLFGPRWQQTAVLMQGLAVAGAFYSLTAFSRQLHAAMYDTTLLFKRDAWLQLPLLIAVIVAAQYNLVMVVVAIACVTFFAMLVHLVLLKRHLDLDIKYLVVSVAPSALLAVLVWVATSLFAGQQSGIGGEGRLIALSTVAAGVTWAAALYLTRHPLLAEAREFVKAWRNSP
ncbi:Teichuronic acid biosynthesis protein TuaB [Altererythrobacter insulae]|nr:Teichuronic acid biosynthesis protein TuaB [Altererythrobacter insulae]